MTWKDKMVLCVLIQNRARVELLMDHEKNDLVYATLEGARDAFSCAIALLRCPLGVLINEYYRIKNGKSK